MNQFAFLGKFFGLLLARAKKMNFHTITVVYRSMFFEA